MRWDIIFNVLFIHSLLVRKIFAELKGLLLPRPTSDLCLCGWVAKAYGAWYENYDLNQNFLRQLQIYSNIACIHKQRALIKAWELKLFILKLLY